MHRFGWMAGLVLVACAQGTSTIAQRSPSSAPPRAVTPISQYRLVPLTVETRQQLDFGDDGLRLYGGIRITERSGQRELADTFAEPAINSGRRLPDFAGGGFLFWSDFAIFRAETFLGRLQPLRGMTSALEHVALGPGYLVGHQGNERWFFDAKTGAPVTPRPLDLTDVAAAGDGRVVTALQFERFAVSLDNNHTMREVHGEVGTGIERISEEPLGFVLDGGVIVELRPDGSLVKNGYQARPTADLRWPARDSPLERAVSAGVLRGEERALAAVGSAVAEVDLRSGKLLSVGPELLPGNPECELFEQGTELLMQCRDDRQVTVLSKLQSRAPTIEQTFRAPAVLMVDKSRALVDMSCEGQHQALSVCVREPSGVWKTVSAPAAAVAAAPVVVSYGFKHDGGIVAFVSHEEQGQADPSRQGYISLDTGKLTAFGGTLPLRYQLAGAVCGVENDGGVCCLSPSGPLLFPAGDERKPTPMTFAWLGSHLERVLAVDHLSQAFQSEDGGKTWVHVDAPKLAQPPSRRDRCSAVGCKLDGWLRIGWQARAPQPRPQPSLVIGASARGEERPRLVCAFKRDVSQTPSPFAHPQTPAYDGKPHPFFADIDAMPVGNSYYSESTRGFLSGRDPGDTSKPLNGSFDFRFLDFFDVTAKPRRARVDASAMQKAALLSGADPPSVDPSSSLKVVPVLAREPGVTNGFVAQISSTLVWVRDGQALVLPPGRSLHRASSVLAESQDELVVLMADGSVLKLSKGLVAPLFRVPGVLSHLVSDALGRASDGELAVLRFSEDVPSAQRPALAYRPGKPPLLLAPWNTAVAATDPACAGDAGYHASIVVSQSWLDLGSDGLASRDQGMTAAVRWSPERVCVEAVEVGEAGAVQMDPPPQLRVVARFAPTPGAVRLATIDGVDLRQTLACELQPPR